MLTLTPGTLTWQWCYAVAFSILALSHAAMIGVEGAEAHLATVLQFAETTFYEPGHGICNFDIILGNFERISQLCAISRAV